MSYSRSKPYGPARPAGGGPGYGEPETVQCSGCDIEGAFEGKIQPPLTCINGVPPENDPSCTLIPRVQLDTLLCNTGGGGVVNWERC